MLCLAVVLTVIGLVLGTTEVPDTNLINTELEWNCRDDHAPHESDRRKFKQSPNGFGPGAAVTESSCPSQLQEFSQVNGVCRCLYVQEVRELLDQSCQVKVPVGAPPDVYQLLDPSRNVETVDELYVQRTCFSLLPKYMQDAYRNAGVVPMFFNQTGCRCDWIEGVDRRIGLAAIAPPGMECERIVDQNFSNPRVSMDEVGNFVSVYPEAFQNNMTLRRGGVQFGNGIISQVFSRLQGFDFAVLELVARFDSELNSGKQVIFTNLCSTPGEDGGFVELSFNPSGRQYSLQFFSERVATCTASAGAGTQAVQLKYKNGEVKLLVNNIECDISSLNRVTDAERLQFNSGCPMMLGGAVKTDIGQDGFGDTDTRVQGLDGVFYRFMALRSCDNPPKMVQDRIAGIVS